MDLRTAILARRSVRAFRPDPVPEEVVAALQEAVRWAPSAGNLQARRFWFVTRAEVRGALGAATYQPELFRAAPLVVVGAAEEGRIAPKYGERGRTLYAVEDVAAATQNLLLVAHAHGWATLWVGAFDEEKVRSALGLRPDQRPLVLVPVGRGAESPAPPDRLGDDLLFTRVD